MMLIKQNTGLLRSVRSWGVLGLVLALAVTFGIERATLPVLAQGERVQANPCQPIVDSAYRLAQTGQKVDTEKLRKDLKECADKNKVAFVETNVGGAQPQGRVTTVVANAGGSVLCINYPQNFVWIFYGGSPWHKTSGSRFHVASVQFESTLASVLTSILPGSGQSVTNPIPGLGRNIPNMLINPALDIGLLVVFTAGFTTPLTGIPVDTAWGFSSPPVFGVYAVCVGLDRSP